MKMIHLLTVAGLFATGVGATAADAQYYGGQDNHGGQAYDVGYGQGGYYRDYGRGEYRRSGYHRGYGYGYGYGRPRWDYGRGYGYHGDRYGYRGWHRHDGWRGW